MADGSLAILTLASGRKANLTFRKENGRILKSAPKTAREADPGTIKELKARVKAIQAALEGQAHRLDQALGSDRSWSAEEWRSRYLNHGLMAVMARRLLWVFEVGGSTTLGHAKNGRVVGIDGQPVAIDGAIVRLFHPQGTDPELLSVLRDRFMDMGLTQPFQQLYRKAYEVSEAERLATSTDRFVGHVLRQQRFIALCQKRGWTYTLQGPWDSWNEPIKVFGPFEVSFGVAPVEGHQEHTGFTYLSVGLLQIVRGQNPVPFGDVPSQILSELLREVDLLVTGSVVANEADITLVRRLFGSTFERVMNTAPRANERTRSEVLTQLLPALDPEDRMSIEASQLRVVGTCNTYRIHLRTGNVISEPSNRVVHIPADAEKAFKMPDVIIPHENDAILDRVVRYAHTLLKDDTIKHAGLREQLGLS